MIVIFEKVTIRQHPMFIFNPKLDYTCVSMSSDVSIDIDINDDEAVKIFTALIGTQTSRDMIKLLVHNKMYSNEICQKLGIKSNTIVPHLKRLEVANLLKITNEKIINKGIEHRFFHIPLSKVVFVLKKPKKDDAKGFPKKIFKEGVKFASIGIAALFSWMVVKPKEIIDDKINPETIPGTNIIVEYTDFVDISQINETVILSIVIPILVISLGFNVERILSKLWNKKKKKG